MNETIRPIITVFQVICCLGLILSVVFQSGKGEGLSASISGAAESFFGKNKARSLDAKLEKITVFSALGFVVLTFILTIL